MASTLSISPPATNISFRKAIMSVWIASKRSHTETGSVLTAQLYGGRIWQHHDCDLSTRLSPSTPHPVLFFIGNVSLPGVREKPQLTGQIRASPAVIEQTEGICLRANKMSTPHPHSVSLFFDLPYLLFRPPTSWKYRGVLSPLEPPLSYSKELLTGWVKRLV